MYRLCVLRPVSAKFDVPPFLRNFTYLSCFFRIWPTPITRANYPISFKFWISTRKTKIRNIAVHFFAQLVTRNKGSPMSLLTLKPFLLFWLAVTSLRKQRWCVFCAYLGGGGQPVEVFLVYLSLRVLSNATRCGLPCQISQKRVLKSKGSE